MRPYATAQLIGGRENQCDATAVRTSPSGARAYVLLDGIGDTPEIREWTRTASVRLARAAARRGDAEAGLRAVYAAYAAEPERQHPYWRHYLPSAAAVVAVTAPGKPLTIAWSGDSRAYVLIRGTVQCLTNDHNLRRVWPPHGNRNRITSYLGSPYTDDEAKAHHGHPAIESVTRVAENCRLLLASDGAYEPIEEDDSGKPLSDHLIGDPAETARAFTETAVSLGGARPDNATVLIADLRP
ncbi:mucin-2 [Streptomyces abikoensis]|uniref:PP2C family protein-serine/threonine phosphatase n=1 Tax=Streptomyces abikoensis TaxID=97398 RepID=UPI0033CC2A34